MTPALVVGGGSSKWQRLERPHPNGALNIVDSVAVKGVPANRGGKQPKFVAWHFRVNPNVAVDAALVWKPKHGFSDWYPTAAQLRELAEAPRIFEPPFSSPIVGRTL
jgi:hypothetical protein